MCKISLSCTQEKVIQNFKRDSYPSYVFLLARKSAPLTFRVYKTNKNTYSIEIDHANHRIFIPIV